MASAASTLDAATSTWAAYPMELIASVHAPTGAIEVAFSVGDRTWVLTANTFHVLFDSMEGSTRATGTAFPEAWRAPHPGGRPRQLGRPGGRAPSPCSSASPRWPTAGSGHVCLHPHPRHRAWRDQADWRRRRVGPSGVAGHDGGFGWTTTSPGTPATAAETPWGLLRRAHDRRARARLRCRLRFAFAASMPAANFPIFNYAGAPNRPRWAQPPDGRRHHRLRRLSPSPRQRGRRSPPTPPPAGPPKPSTHRTESPAAPSAPVVEGGRAEPTDAIAQGPAPRGGPRPAQCQQDRTVGRTGGDHRRHPAGVPAGAHAAPSANRPTCSRTRSASAGGGPLASDHASKVSTQPFL